MTGQHSFNKLRDKLTPAQKAESERFYAVMIEPLSEADGSGWLASVLALPGCMGDGDTREEALADVERAITEWKDAAKQLGRNVPSPVVA
jgi:antitoxin HicB